MVEERIRRPGPVRMVGSNLASITSSGAKRNLNYILNDWTNVQRIHTLMYLPHGDTVLHPQFKIGS